MEIVGGQSVLKELPVGPTLFSASSQDRPDTSIPLPTHHRAATLFNPSVNNRLAKGLLSSIVGWGHSRIKQEPKHRIAMLDKAFRNRGRLRRQIFPHFIGAKLPVGVTSLLIAAVFAAAMSTVSTSLNSSATLIMRDYYQRYVNPLASERQSMAVLYGATVVWGMLGTGVALLLVQVTSALDAWWTLSGRGLRQGDAWSFLLGMISRRAGNPAAVTGVCLGILVIGWMTLSKYLPDRWTALRSPFHAFMIPVLGTLTILLSGLLVSRFTTSPTSIVCASEDNENSIERRTS